MGLLTITLGLLSTAVEHIFPSPLESPARILRSLKVCGFPKTKRRLRDIVPPFCFGDRAIHNFESAGKTRFPQTESNPVYGDFSSQAYIKKPQIARFI